MFGGAGVRTQFGGDIQMLTPGGSRWSASRAQVPPASAGIVTQGSGDIQIYSKGSVLLGLSRIMTTFGGDILAWSAEGDINAGRGAKTTVVYTPPRRVYDDYGNVDAVAAGAVLRRRHRHPQPNPGNRAGRCRPDRAVRHDRRGRGGHPLSGNVNLAALHIVNAANIQAQGNVTGMPQVQAPNIGRADRGVEHRRRRRQQAAAPAQGSGNAQPSIIIVEVLGFGGGDGCRLPKMTTASVRSGASAATITTAPFRSSVQAN